jgi:hypothetical protein
MKLAPSAGLFDVGELRNVPINVKVRGTGTERGGDAIKLSR